MASAPESSPQPTGTFWGLSLEGPLPEVAPRLKAVFGRVEAEAVQELAEAMGLDDSTLAQKRFARQCRCYGAWVAGALAAYGWVTFDEERIGELGVRFRLKPGEAYIWDCATLPAYRGQRLYPALQSFINKELQAEGLQRAWIGADTTNLASQKGFRLAGFQPVADVVSTSGGAVSMAHIHRRRDGPRELYSLLCVHGRFGPDVPWLQGE